MYNSAKDQKQAKPGTRIVTLERHHVMMGIMGLSLSDLPHVYPSEIPKDVIFQQVAELPTVDEAIELLAREAVRRCKGNVSRAIKMIGMSRTNFYYRCLQK